MLKLNDYLEIAKNYLKRHQSYLLQSEDAISDIANAMMWADHTWDGRGTKQGWRALRAKHVLFKLIKPKRKFKKLTNIPYWSSLDDIIDMKDTFCELTENEYLCVTKFYLENLRIKDIAYDLNISHQYVSQCLKNGIERLKGILNDDET